MFVEERHVAPYFDCLTIAAPGVASSSHRSFGTLCPILQRHVASQGKNHD